MSGSGVNACHDGGLYSSWLEPCPARAGQPERPTGPCIAICVTVGLGGRHGNLRAGPGVQHVVRLAGDGAADDVDDGQSSARPARLASRRAAMVSSVSPDWLMTMTSVLLVDDGVACSGTRRPARPRPGCASAAPGYICRPCPRGSEEPQAMILDRDVDTGGYPAAGPQERPLPSLMRGRMARRSASGCSMISLSMKCS